VFRHWIQPYKSTVNQVLDSTMTIHDKAVTRLGKRTSRHLDGDWPPMDLSFRWIDFATVRFRSGKSILTIGGLPTTAGAP
jgi:hypothetical protein